MARHAGRAPKPNAKAPVGQGGRFAALKTSIGRKGKVRNPGAVAASIGRKKYGKQRFQMMASAGRKHESMGDRRMAARMKGHG